jgi:alpha-ketoglutarate-dependent taurine dioxygenase
MDNLKWVKMGHGDVVLLDNYMTMHGRNIFSGVRKHAVTWFK